MTFARWLLLSEGDRENEKRSWLPFEPGYWHALAVEAAARFKVEFGSKRHVVRVCKSLYRARELIVAVQTDLRAPKKLELPSSYAGFRVMQFARQTPEGVLVDPGPPSKSSPRPKAAPREYASGIPQMRIRKPVAGSHRIVALEGEIDMHVSARIASELQAFIQAKPERFVIDLSNVSYIDSSGLAVLINAMRKVEAYRGRLYLAGMQKGIQSIFETSRLKQVFRIRRDVAEALNN